jgi:hypothetical protein
VSRYLAHLAERALGRAEPLRPRLPSRYEPRATSVPPPPDPVEQEVAQTTVAAEDDAGRPHRGLLIDGGKRPRTDRGRAMRPEPLDESASEPVAARPGHKTRDAAPSDPPSRPLGPGDPDPASQAETLPREPSADVADGGRGDPQPEVAPQPAARPATKGGKLPPAREGPPGAPPVEGGRETSKDEAPGFAGRERRTQGAPPRAMPAQGDLTDADRTEVRDLQPMHGDDGGRTRRPEPSPLGEAPGTSAAQPARPTPTPGERSPPKGVPPVRITIGRIEVRAVTAEAPRASQPQTRPPRMSLGEYLRGEREDTRR